MTSLEFGNIRERISGNSQSFTFFILSSTINQLKSTHLILKSQLVNLTECLEVGRVCLVQLELCAVLASYPAFLSLQNFFFFVKNESLTVAIFKKIPVEYTSRILSLSPT